jgi:hypothetical protein
MQKRFTAGALVDCGVVPRFESDEPKDTAMIAMHAIASSSRFEIRFESLFVEGRGLAFPCSEDGRVDMDALTERSRSNYLFARAMLGREYATPRVVPSRH